MESAQGKDISGRRYTLPERERLPPSDNSASHAPPIALKSAQTQLQQHPRAHFISEEETLYQSNEPSEMQYAILVN